MTSINIDFFQKVNSRSKDKTKHIVLLLIVDFKFSYLKKDFVLHDDSNDLIRTSRKYRR